jgi:hypothetical protein
MQSRRIYLIILCLTSLAAPTRADKVGTPRDTLASAVPGDVRIFIEFRDLNSILQSPSGEILAGVLENLIGPHRFASSQPAPQTLTRLDPPLASWQRQLMLAIGMTNEDAATLLLQGKLAIAADSWNGLDDAILLAEPTNVATMEKELKSFRVNVPGKPLNLALPEVKPLVKPSIHYYSWGQDHQLCCDGRFVVAGRASSPSGLYTRTIGLWRSENGIALSDLADFTERTAALSPDRQLLLFVTAGRRTNTENRTILADGLWPGIWPELKSFAVGITLTSDGVVIDTGGRTDPMGFVRQACTTSADYFSKLPDATIAAWVERINYVEEYRRITRGLAGGVLRFYLDVLQTGLAPGNIEQQLLAPLTGDTIFAIGQTEYAPNVRVRQDPLLLPAVALGIKTANSAGAAQVLRQVTENLLRLLNVQARTGSALQLSERKLDSVDEVIHTIPIGQFFGTRTACEFLKTMTLSWTVADDWIVVATGEGMIEKMVRARRGLEPTLSPATLAENFRRGNDQAKLMMIVQPRAAGEMIDSWIGYLSHYHPQMLLADWWSGQRQKQRVSAAQLGILPSSIQNGAIEVAQTVPNGPADHRLQPGDRIVAVEGRRLEPRDPQRSLRLFLNGRRDPNRVVVTIIREENCEEDIELSLAPPAPRVTVGTSPVELLREAADLLRIFSTANYAMWEPTPGLFNARLDLHFAPTNAAAR